MVAGGVDAPTGTCAIGIVAECEWILELHLSFYESRKGFGGRSKTTATFRQYPYPGNCKNCKLQFVKPAKKKCASPGFSGSKCAAPGIWL
jgi:hypothetical protein